MNFDLIVTVIQTVSPVLCIVCLGYTWVRAGRKLDTAIITPIATDVATPCLIISTLLKIKLEPDIFFSTLLASVLALTLFSLVGVVVITVLGLRLKTFLPAVAFPNAGNLGLPMALYAFGPQGLGHAVIFFALSSIGNYTIGQAIAAGRANWTAILKMPLIYSVIFGMVASYIQIYPPKPIADILSMLGGMAVPLMLLMLGGALAKLNVSAVNRAVAISALRIGSGFAIGLFVVYLFKMDGVQRSSIIMQCAMPAAVYTYLFAQRWNNQPEEVAGVVFVSTVMSVVTTPMVLTWLLYNN